MTEPPPKACGSGRVLPMNVNLRAMCTRRQNTQHGSARRPPSTRRARCRQQGRSRGEKEKSSFPASLRAVRNIRSCDVAPVAPRAPRRVRGLNGHAGVHVRPGSGRATAPNGPPLSRLSRSVPEAVCLRGFGQTLPVSLASPLRGRDSGDPAGSTRPTSFWSSWCPSVLLGPGSTALEIPGGVPLRLQRRHGQRSRSSPQYPGIQAGVQGVSTHLLLGSPFFAEGVGVLWWLVIL
ncbi:hypothetical protein P4O66_007679 [Electrophorus voltai]|uniref:Uncharacterized protein n=1 Tax=Electrophorus voltai TaxID=2609070 RepID=A0AAD8ZH84_9TELE|nr:hypothetical protein P4O66_007679 [Electrophorus voltai]